MKLSKLNPYNDAIIYTKRKSRYIEKQIFEFRELRQRAKNGREIIELLDELLDISAEITKGQRENRDPDFFINKHQEVTLELITLNKNFRDLHGVKFENLIIRNLDIHIALNSIAQSAIKWESEVKLRLW